jgi:hypothetical protein
LVFNIGAQAERVRKASGIIFETDLMAYPNKINDAILKIPSPQTAQHDWAKTFKVYEPFLASYYGLN